MLKTVHKSPIPLFLLRITLGWLFLHEGITKLLQPGWSSFYYMQEAHGPIKGFLSWISLNETLLKIADFAVVALLIGAGILLILGLFERIGAAIGMLLLLMFYLAYPPFGNIPVPLAEGNYLVVDKNLILFIALLVLWQFRTGLVLGLDRFLKRKDQIS